MSKELFDKILQASALINLKAQKVSGNYMVVSKAVADVITGFKRGSRKEKIKKLFPDE
jgi:hypothetical protein